LSFSACGYYRGGLWDSNGLAAGISQIKKEEEYQLSLAAYYPVFGRHFNCGNKMFE